MLNRFSNEEVNKMLLSLARNLYNIYPRETAGTPANLPRSFGLPLSGTEFLELLREGGERNMLAFTIHGINGEHHVSGLTQIYFTEDLGARFGLPRRR